MSVGDLATKNSVRDLEAVHARLRACRLCPKVEGCAVHGPALETRLMLVGQAPGLHEERLGRPFAYTAGRVLFRWLLEATGVGEGRLRERIYFSAVARCFPGKAPRGKGDRVPSPQEIANCSPHLRDEIAAIRPQIILAVGKVAIAEVLAEVGVKKDTPLEELVGRKIRARFHGFDVDVIPLPHPSGVSRWPHVEPGKSKLREALERIHRDVTPLLA